MTTRSGRPRQNIPTSPREILDSFAAEVAKQEDGGKPERAPAPSVSDITKTNEVRHRVVILIAAQREEYQLLHDAVYGSREPAPVNRLPAALLCDMERGLHLNQQGIKLLRRVAEKEIAAGFRQGNELQRSLALGATDKTLRDRYQDGTMVDEDGTIEKVYGILPILSLGMGVTFQYFTPTEAVESVRLLEVVTNIKFRGADGTFNPTTPASELSEALSAVVKVNAEAEWHTLYRKIVGALALVATAKYTVLDENNEPIDWSPSATAFVLKMSTHNNKFPHTQKDIEEVSKWLDRMSRLDSRHKALVGSVAAHAGSGAAAVSTVGKYTGQGAASVLATVVPSGASGLELKHRNKNVRAGCRHLPGKQHHVNKYATVCPHCYNTAKSFKCSLCGLLTPLAYGVCANQLTQGCEGLATDKNSSVATAADLQKAIDAVKRFKMAKDDKRHPKVNQVAATTNPALVSWFNDQIDKQWDALLTNRSANIGDPWGRVYGI